MRASIDIYRQPSLWLIRDFHLASLSSNTGSFDRPLIASRKIYGTPFIPHNMGDDTKREQVPLDPKKLFQLVSKNYESWQATMNVDAKTKDGKPTNNQPIFKYNLLELLEKAPSEIDLQSIISQMGIEPLGEADAERASEPGAPLADPILNEQEIDFLRNKITQMINFRPQKTTPHPLGGMSLYDTKDEPGIIDEDQDDYDLDEITNDDYYNLHHIEVELNSHRDGECTCGDDHDEDGPTCEFTFEYDKLGNLVPTYSNVEEKLRLMSLQQKLGKNGLMKLPLILELNLIDSPSTTQPPAKKKKLKRKKKKLAAVNANPSLEKVELPPPPPGQIPPCGVLNNPDCCLFCEYTLIYGKKPRQLIKWYNQRLRREEERRQEIKRKIETVKQRALKRQQQRSDDQTYTHDDHHHDGYDDDHTDTCPHHDSH